MYEIKSLSATLHFFNYMFYDLRHKITKVQGQL